MLSRFSALVLLGVLIPAPASAWGDAAHRYIMERAIDLLPAEIRPFFDGHRNELILRVNDPDLWRVVGWDESAHHFLDFDAEEYGPYPFRALPRDHGAAVERFGAETLKRYGLLPWRASEMFGTLRRALQGFPKSAPYAAADIVLFAAATAHYIQDAYQPLHATINYDGQATNQRGVHARFERNLFERYRAQIVVTPARPRAMTAPRDAAFEALLESYQLVGPLLAADKAAARGTRTYDDRYYQAFFAEAGPILARRMSQSITATASMIIGAWTAADRPALRARGGVSSSVTSTVPPARAIR
jgi:hypothetical protein